MVTFMLWICSPSTVSQYRVIFCNFCSLAFSQTRVIITVVYFITDTQHDFVPS